MYTVNVTVRTCIMQEDKLLICTHIITKVHLKSAWEYHPTARLGKHISKPDLLGCLDLRVGRLKLFYPMGTPSLSTMWLMDVCSIECLMPHTFAVGIYMYLTLCGHIQSISLCSTMPVSTMGNAVITHFRVHTLY